MPVVVVDGCEYAVTANGYLLDQTQWTVAVADALAATDGVTLGQTHRAVIDYLRNYYDEYHMMPLMRVLTAAMRKQLGDDAGSSSALYRAFPFGPIRQGARYAGLPEPAACF